MTLLSTNNVRLNLQLFSDGGTASAGAVNAVGVSEITDGVSGENSIGLIPDKAKQKKSPLSDVKYGKQDTNTEKNETPEQKHLSFKELVKSEEYAPEAQQYFEKRINKRLSKFKNIEQENARMREIMSLNNARYGLNPNDADYIEKYAQAAQNDTKLFEDEAVAAGMSVEHYVKVKNAERIIENDKIAKERLAQQERFNASMAQLEQQAVEMKQQFPNFDLQTEMNDERFRRLVTPWDMGGAGLSLEDAFRSLHRKEIDKQLVNDAINKATINVANTVQNNKSRPSENGLSHSTPVTVKDDPSKLTLEDFKEIRERFLRTGERVKF